MCSSSFWIWRSFSSWIMRTFFSSILVYCRATPSSCSNFLFFLFWKIQRLLRHADLLLCLAHFLNHSIVMFQLSITIIVKFSKNAHLLSLFFLFIQSFFDQSILRFYQKHLLRLSSPWLHLQEFNHKMFKFYQQGLIIALIVWSIQFCLCFSFKFMQQVKPKSQITIVCVFTGFFQVFWFNDYVTYIKVPARLIPG